MSPTACCHVDFTLTADLYPTEISWNLFDSTENVVIEDVPFKSGLYGELATYNVIWPCLTSDDFIFTIKDKIGDGLCHDGSCGSYSLKVNGVEIASADQYDNYSFQEETHFTCSDTGGGPPVVSQEPSLTPTTSSNPSSALPSNIPSIEPSKSVSPSMQPTPECSCSAQLTLHTDKYPGDTGWTLTELFNDGSLSVIDEHEMKSGYKRNTQYEHDWSCLSNNEYEFTIEDFWQDGLSCFKESKKSTDQICGWYTLEVDGTVIHGSGPGVSGNFGKEEVVRFSCSSLSK
jgi:hypothetical protein